MRSGQFYLSSYKETQRLKSKAAWQRGCFDSLLRREKRKCIRPGCGKSFVVIPSNPKKFCSHNCSASLSNAQRCLSAETKSRISKGLKGRVSPHKGLIKIPRAEIICANPLCSKHFLIERWKRTKFCSVACSMHIIGSWPTSPKAARAKAGVRKDVSDYIYFYSRWEANLARLFNFLNVKWVHQPRTFDLRDQTYTPDFYLPDYDLYLEVKNFMGDYSRARHEKFKKYYTRVKLELILKPNYLEFETKFSKSIPKWEYKNSKFEFISSKRIPT